MDEIKHLFELAEQFFGTFQFDKSAVAYAEILKKQPNNNDALDGLGTILVEVGEIERAKECFAKSISVSPTVGFQKYMTLAQLCTGKESEQNFIKGIEIMRKERDRLAQKQKANPMDVEAKNELRFMDRALSSGYCSIVELYLSDLCFEQNAEQMCEKSLDMGRHYDEKNPEIFQLYASVRISQKKTEEAKKFLMQSFQLWNHDSVAPDEIPSVPFRTQTAKLFIELSNYEVAIQILKQLLKEIDSLPEIWYLLGLAYCKYKPNECGEEAIDCLTSAKELLTSPNEMGEEQEFISEIDELLGILQTQTMGEGEDEEMGGEVEMTPVND